MLIRKHIPFSGVGNLGFIPSLISETAASQQAPCGLRTPNESRGFKGLPRQRGQRVPKRARTVRIDSAGAGSHSTPPPPRGGVRFDPPASFDRVPPTLIFDPISGRRSGELSSIGGYARITVFPKKIGAEPEKFARGFAPQKFSESPAISESRYRGAPC